jgi:hypothetical protein
MKFRVQQEKTQFCKKQAHINDQSRQIISNLKSDLESFKIPNSNPELASILKFSPKPMTPSQITNTKILSLIMSKLKQFLSLKDEQLNKSSQWNNLKEKISNKSSTKNHLE